MNKKYNRAELQKEYDSGLTYRDLQNKYGISQATITKAMHHGILKLETHQKQLN